MLGKYLESFTDIQNVREKIKKDFDLDRIFEENRQSKAVKKVKNNHESLMQDILKEKESMASVLSFSH
jgi:hypothetical protein